MYNNIIELPTAKTYLHHNPKKPGADVLEYVYDHGLMKLAGKQKKLLEKRIKIADQIIKFLPASKRHLFNEYVELQLQDACVSIDKAIKYTIEHEAEINEILASY